METIEQILDDGYKVLLPVHGMEYLVLWKHTAIDSDFVPIQIWLGPSISHIITL
jgi:hypothetical protein